MGSLIGELQRREAAAGAEAGELRGRIAELTGRLARAEERLSRLVIAREAVDEVLSEAGADAPPAVERELTTRPRRSPVIGVVMVPPWRAGLEVSVLPQEYRDLLEVAGDAGRPLRAAQIAAAAGLGTGPGEGGDLAVEAEAADRAGLAGRGRRGCSRCPPAMATARGCGRKRGERGLFFLGSQVPARTDLIRGSAGGSAGE